MDSDIENIILKQEQKIYTKILLNFTCFVLVSFVIYIFIIERTQIYIKDYIALGITIILCLVYPLIQENYIYITNKNFLIKNFDGIHKMPIYKVHKISFDNIKKIDCTLTRFGTDILIIDTVQNQRFTAIGSNAEKIIEIFKKFYPQYKKD